MTSETMRHDEKFMRNGYGSSGCWNFSKVSAQDISLEDIELLSYSDTKPNDILNRHRAVHFFIDDYRFESVYKNPEKNLNKLSQYRFLISPDFSVYADMPRWRQIESVAKSRWCGAYWQSKGLTVIPCISWSDTQSFDFCFDGIPKNATVAIGMNGCKHSRLGFLNGYNAMLKTLSPSNIICLGKPYPEMKGNIISIKLADARKAVR